MDSSKIIIRAMKNGEQKEIIKIGKKAFSFFEGLFIGTPKQAMVAEYEGKIIGSIIYKYINTISKKVVYIDEAFVAPDFHNLGVGKKLYTETFKYLWEQDCEVMTALVKDDNVGSWKLFVDNGFKRTSLKEVIKEIGFVGMLKQYTRTPWLVGVGMDFYMTNKEKTIQEKDNTSLQIISFLFANILLILPVWINYFINQSQKLVYSLLAYITILLLFIGCRYIGTLFNKDKWKFRLNNGGSFLTLLLSFFGNTFLMNANWYPEKYEKTKEFKRKLAIPELIKWVVFLILPLLAFTDNLYLMAMAQIACYYLLFIIIPVYPFESLGAGRIYNYNKRLWLVIFIISIIELIIMFNITK